MMAKGNIRPFRTKSKIEHLLDIYTNDLTVYLEFDIRFSWRNKENVRRVLEVIEKFYLWSGLKINLGKTYVTIFGRELNKPRFVEELRIKWCNEFKL